MKVVFVFCGILLIVIGLPLAFTVEICPAPGLCNTAASAKENALGLAFLIVGACLTAFGLFSKEKPLLKNNKTTQRANIPIQNKWSELLRLALKSQAKEDSFFTVSLPIKHLRTMNCYQVAAN